MAVRAADRVTLAVLPAPSYVRTYYLMQESTLDAPLKPTTNPPADPWRAAEPAYTAGSTLTLYTAMVTVYGSVSFDWGDVQKSSSYEAAKQAYNLAAANATTIDGMRRLIASVAEPTAPAGGWMNGDQWWQYEVEPVTGRNRLSNIWVWNGTTFVPFQIVADSLLIPGSVGNILLADGAVDAMTIRGAQIYGGYIEAPVIASSDKLGTGANVLNDPGFASTVDTSWVRSGFTGDTVNKTQADTISWDQTWQQEEWSYPEGTVSHGVRNWGAVVANATLSPDNTKRTTGSLLFPNISWMNTTARSFTNPYTFVNKAWLQGSPAQGGGSSDPTFNAVNGAPAPVVGTARTTYLTNTASVAVVAGERWNARMSFTRLSWDQAESVQMWLEVIDATSAAVLWSVELAREEITAGSVNAWWDVAASATVKYRIKVTYTAGGPARFVRRPQTGSFARKWTKSAMVNEWITNPTTEGIAYASTPIQLAAGSYLTMPTLWQSRVFEMKATSALFAKVEPEKGWRLTEDGGLELFNALGAKTGQLDGEDNFISGRLGTSESGTRWELVGDSIKLYSAANVVLAEIKRNGTQLEIAAGTQGILLSGGGDVKQTGDTDWVVVGNASGNSPRAKYRRRGGFVELVGRLSRGAGGYGVITFPSGFRPADTLQFANPNNGIYELYSNGSLATGNANQTVCDFNIRFEANGS